MHATPFVLPAVVAFLVVTSGLSAFAQPQLFDDGQTHTVDTVLRSESGSTKAAEISNDSTLIVLDGAIVSGIDVLQGQLNVQGGWVVAESDLPPAALAAGTSIVQIQGGIIDWAWFDDSSQLYVEGGFLENSFLRDESVGSMTGGRLGQLVLNDRSSFHLQSGEVDNSSGIAVQLSNRSMFTMSGGSINVDDASPTAGILATADSQVSISGGSITISEGEPGASPEPHLVARHRSSIEIYGTDFNYPLGTIDAIEGSLTGVLADGTPINWLFERSQVASISLVPEPQGSVPPLIAIFLILTRLFRPRQSSTRCCQQ